jgi:hypothetical protein
MVHLDNCSVHASRASIDWLDEYGMRRMPYQSYLPNLARVISIYFIQWKKNSNEFRWLTRISFLSACKRFWIYWSKRIEWHISRLGEASSRSKPRQWRLH